jgi:hypothetical protein
MITTFTAVTFMDETITINTDDMVIIDGVEWNITDICDDGTFFARSADGEENFFEIDDIG